MLSYTNRNALRHSRRAFVRFYSGLSSAGLSAGGSGVSYSGFFSYGLSSKSGMGTGSDTMLMCLAGASMVSGTLGRKAGWLLLLAP